MHLHRFNHNVNSNKSSIFSSTHSSSDSFIVAVVTKSSVQFSHSVISKSLRPHGLQHARLLCPSPITIHRNWPNTFYADPFLFIVSGPIFCAAPSLFIIQFSLVTQSCPTLCNPMNCSRPGLPVHHKLLGFTQTHVH